MNEYVLLKEKLDQIKKDGLRPSLLLHSCCGPCSSYTLEFLDQYFDITIYYYNPNIYPEEEFDKRLEEQKKVIEIVNPKIKLHFNKESYNVYEEAVKGLEHLGELSKRCYNCYEFRLVKLASVAKKFGFDYFTTTLSISPYKSSKWINEIGKRLESDKCLFLYSDFKKEGGYQKSIAFCKEHNIYRQDYCGCKASIEEHYQRLVTKENKLSN